MNVHYLPVKFASQVIWLNNYKSKIAVHGTALGLTATQLADEVQWCDDIIAAINNIETKSAELKSARNTKTTTDKVQLAALRANIARHKTHPDYNTTIGGELGVMSCPEIGLHKKCKLNENNSTYIRIKTRARI